MQAFLSKQVVSRFGSLRVRAGGQDVSRQPAEGTRPTLLSPAARLRARLPVPRGEAGAAGERGPGEKGPLENVEVLSLTPIQTPYAWHPTRPSVTPWVRPGDLANAGPGGLGVCFVPLDCSEGNRGAEAVA